MKSPERPTLPEGLFSCSGVGASYYERKLKNIPFYVTKPQISSVIINERINTGLFMEKR